MNKYKYIQYMEKKALSPLTTMLSGVAAGGTLGTGAAWWNNDDNYMNKALIGAGIGSIPGLIQAIQQYARSYKDISFGNKPGLKWYEPFTLDPKKLIEKSPSYRRNIRPLVYKDRLESR